MCAEKSTAMASRPPKPPPARTIGAFRPTLGVMALVDVDGTFRPFLPVQERSATSWAGWVFTDPAQDWHTTFLRERGFQAADRRTPCYCEVPVASLRPAPKE